MARRPSYQNYYQSFMSENMNPLYKRYLEYLMEDLPDVSDIGGYIDVPTTAEREGLESLKDDVKTPMGPVAPMNQTRGGDGDQRGIGRFQNLDEDSVKYFNLNGKIVKGYKNLNSGLYQTEDGKNIIGAEEAGISAAGAFPGAGYIPDQPGIMGFGGGPLSLMEQRKTAIQNQKIYEEKLEQQRIEQQKAAEEAARREAQRKQIQDLQNKIDQGQYGGGGGGGTGSGGRGTTSNPGRDPGSYGGGRDMGSTSSGGYGSGKDRGSSLHG